MARISFNLLFYSATNCTHTTRNRYEYCQGWRWSASELAMALCSSYRRSRVKTVQLLYTHVQAVGTHWLLAHCHHADIIRGLECIYVALGTRFSFEQRSVSRHGGDVTTGVYLALAVAAPLQLLLLFAWIWLLIGRPVCLTLSLVV